MQFSNKFSTILNYNVHFLRLSWATSGHLGLSQSILSFFRLSQAISSNLWLSRDNSGYLRLSLDISGISGYPFLYLAVLGNIRLSQAISIKY